MRRIDVNMICGASLLLFSLVVIFIIIPDQISFKSAGLIQPEFYPRLLGVAIGILSAVLIARGILKPENITSEKADMIRRPIKGAALIRMIGILAVTYLHVYLIPIIGYLITTICTLALLMVMLGVRKLRYLVSIPLLVPVSLFFFFEKGMRIMLPRGMLF